MLVWFYNFSYGFVLFFLLRVFKRESWRECTLCLTIVRCFLPLHTLDHPHSFIENFTIVQSCSCWKISESHASNLLENVRFTYLGDLKPWKFRICESSEFRNFWNFEASKVWNFETIDRLFMVSGSWLMAQGSWLMPQGAWLKAHGSWPRNNWR